MKTITLIIFIIVAQKILLGQTIIGNIKVIDEIEFSEHTVYNPFQMEIYNNHIIIHDHGSEKKSFISILRANL